MYKITAAKKKKSKSGMYEPRISPLARPLDTIAPNYKIMIKVDEPMFK